MLILYNTLTRKKEVFKPINKGKINLFVCGITPYDYPHIGHAKTYIQFDFITKYLRFKKFNVFYLQNVTDIDDKIIQRAKEEDQSWKEISKKFQNIFYEDMEKLHVDSINKYAKATDNIKEIVNQVKRLIEKRCAYKLEDGYYFDLSKFKNYGKLSRRNYTEAEDALSKIDDNLSKKNKGDFCLWKFSKKNEPFWKSELGDGRPGWHIEDTAITEKYLGSQYDIHGGAKDLIFPHHEAEIAQMESISNKVPLVRYWLHTGFLNVKGSKMSKSLKNFIIIRDALKQYDYKILRFFFFAVHYRSQIDFSDDALKQAENTLNRISEFLLNSKNKKGDIDNKLVNKTKESFLKALDNDFDTPKALSILFKFIREANKKTPGQNCYNLLKEIDDTFDIFYFDELKISKEIQTLVNKREKYRKEKNYKKSDEIRDIIQKKGYVLEDSKEGIKIKNALR
ncbi:MAG: cysteine--tRNA ligase [Nanoarchaeota archaeon]|nr:cysteine--tRNA ligase [Nanoarchaeota archaeon]